MNNSIQAVVLVKNEINNLPRSLPGLLNYFPVVVYDSGSTDGSQDFCRRLGVEVVDYRYVDHYTAYADVIGAVKEDRYVLILDADMVVSAELAAELSAFAESGRSNVAAAPILWVHSGIPIPHASMCPPKPILFRGGKSPFVQVGHCEKIPADIPVCLLKNKLRHDDQKSFSRVMQNQVFYAEKMLERYTEGKSNWRDRVRANGPWIIPLVFFKSYLFNAGFLDGRAGWLYAMDRVLVELLMYRCGLAKRLNQAAGEKHD